MSTTINLRRKDRLIKVKHVANDIKVKHVTRDINLKHVGRPGVDGDTGPEGPVGPGLPSGGTTGQIITKASNDDYDFEYSNPNDLADKNFLQSFTVVSLVTVSHNLDKYPSVTVIDTAGDEVEGEVVYLSTNQLTVIFANPFSGTVTCN